MTRRWGQSIQNLSLGRPKFQDPENKIQFSLVRLLNFELEIRRKTKGGTLG